MITIVEYETQYAQAFKTLNEEWIKKYFEIEASDRKMLNDPQKSILDEGGTILIALKDEEPVGVCALVKLDSTTFELAKMAVSPKAQGQKIGWMLGNAIISKAKEFGANKVFLETNSILTPAINLYSKLGFSEIQGCDSEYSRCNVQMELKI